MNQKKTWIMLSLFENISMSLFKFNDISILRTA